MALLSQGTLQLYRLKTHEPTPEEARHFLLSHVSRVLLLAILWTVACKAPLSMGFSRQECWSWLPCPPPGDLPNPGIKPMSLISPALAGGFFINSTTGKPSMLVIYCCRRRIRPHLWRDKNQGICGYILNFHSCPLSEIIYNPPHTGGFLGGSMVKNMPAKQETQVWPLGQEVPLEKKWSPTLILAWEIPWT